MTNKLPFATVPLAQVHGGQQAPITMDELKGWYVDGVSRGEPGYGRDEAGLRHIYRMLQRQPTTVVR